MFSIPKKNVVKVEPSTHFRRGSRFWYASSLFPDGINFILDYGCFDGSFLDGLAPKFDARYGVDRNARQIQENIVKYPEIQFSPLENVSTGYPSEFFHAISCLEVLEHVPSESELIAELHRVMAPGGTLVLSVPHKGFLAFLDTGNIKFKFPWLIKFYYYYIKRDPITYRRRFIDAEYGLIGDVSVSENMEHKHYDVNEIIDLMKSRFYVEKVIYYGFFSPIIDVFKILFCLILRLEFVRPYFERLDDFDKQFSYGAWSYNVIVQARRLPNTQSVS